MRGRAVGRYRIIDKIGAGGMGEVYRAHDEELDRVVAVKLLPPSASGDATARARMLREARAAAALNHPNVCTIHDVGEVEGQVYIAMEYVEGEPLSARLERGPLGSEDALRCGRQLAEALAHAHERGVVHRDLKSANVVLTADGRTKVLDFGLARRLPVSGTETETPGPTHSALTEPGTVLGTPAYMAPEQLRGAVADARSDIWALGVILYEMTAGSRPFRGQTWAELCAAILREKPPPLGPTVPQGLQKVIERSLQKAPESRYQLARELAADLQQTATPARVRASSSRKGAAPQIRSLAVLPLTNLSGDPDQDYFADGMTEALISELARFGALKVISRTSAMRYKHTEKALPEIAEELKVDAVVEGSVLRAGNRVRVTAQLIHANTDTHLWAESYERGLEDVLVLQGDVAAAVCREINVALGAQAARQDPHPRVSPEAHDAYLKGRFHWYKLTPQDLDRSLRYFERALALDPQYALAHTGIAQYWTGLAAAGAMPPREAMARARAEASKAAAIDPALAEAHHLLAVIAVWHDFDWSGGESQFRRALALKPGLPDARLFYGLFLAALGRFEEARTEIARALDLDPYNFFFVWISGFALLLERRYVEAKAQIRKALAMEPAFATAHWGLWSALHAERRQEEALVEAEAALGLFAAGAPEAAGLLAMGGPAGYQTAMSRAAGTLARRAGKYVMGTVVAELYACAGERTEALSWLERAYENRDIPMAYLGVHPAWDDLRGEPRFQQLLLRLNLAARP